MVCYAAALLCLMYCIGIVLTKAAGTKFFLVWLVLAGFLAGLGLGIRSGWLTALPQPVKAAGIVCLCLGLAVFVLTEGLIVSGFFAKGEAGLPYLVVLGAQMKENGPSVALARRLDRAAGYLADNPETICVVSGGQGSNEPVSEAQGMQDYLVKKGIDPARIFREDASCNTMQNLQFSRKLIPAGVTKVGIVTSNFHVYRSICLAKSQGFPDAVGIAAPSGVYFLPNNMLREFFGVIKDWLVVTVHG